ncbi:putative predicted metal-dependent hydrolase [Nonlabens ulvanivorans]|uniref:Putative predicted metal-dependent hydrolase n=1 Tax=Nonlabens ulvanivorans TaxID=906888 RepID=A0A081D6B8_NONUL|nr:SprT family zinc-dependent metalloprotease [Nonlabens ulvanivorans]GAK74464.1 putative predicted metal-dependent hydrolase [Nonlabens ulvanivorans]
MNKSILYGSEKIDYKLIFVDRKSLGITVQSDKSVVVKAPVGSSIDLIDKKILKRASWILKQKDHFLSFEPRITKRKYVTGETHLYLGRQYQLVINNSDKDYVKFTGARIEIFTRNKSDAKSILEKWYKEKAQLLFPKLAEPLIQRFEKHGVSPPKKLELRNMKLRWGGSCSPNGMILLNPELIKAPKACIEYVIVHELCHLIYKDHNKKFFNLQSYEMPNWEKWKSKLEMILA